MRCVLTFIALVAVASFDVSQAEGPTAKPGKKTDIRNKNVNIIVNMDPKQVAAELWNVIKEHLTSLNPQSAAKTVREIETAITPMVTPTRRGAAVPVARVADDLEGITRRLLSREDPNIDPVQLEVKTKVVSTELMNSLQSMSQGAGVEDRKGTVVKGMKKGKFHQPSKYVVLPIKIRKTDLADALAEI